MAKDDVFFWMIILKASINMSVFDNHAAFCHLHIMRIILRYLKTAAQ